MQLEVGQVYQRRDTPADFALVLEVRDEKRPRGLGEGYGDSAIAVTLDPREQAYDVGEGAPVRRLDSLRGPGASRRPRLAASRARPVHAPRRRQDARNHDLVRRRTMNDTCICGHTADDHEDDGIGLCNAVACPCSGFELDLDEDADAA